MTRALTVSLPSSDGLPPWTTKPDGVRLVIWDGSGEPPDGADEIELFVGRPNAEPPPAEALDQMPRLRVVQLFSAGYDRWQSVVPGGVTLCNGRGIHGSSTAELAVAGLLAVVRELPAFGAAQREHRWDQRFTGGLAGKRVLVLGAGDIGRRVADAVRPFDAQPVLLARIARDDVRSTDELPALLPQADALVLALPLNPHTHRLVDAAFLAALPDGAVLVNVARGPIVDTGALLAELTSRRLHAFLDVTDPEPLPAGHPLWDAPNLILTPHVGGGTRGWVGRAYALLTAQVERLARGEQLANVVT